MAWAINVDQPTTVFRMFSISLNISLTDELFPLLCTICGDWWWAHLLASVSNLSSCLSWLFLAITKWIWFDWQLNWVYLLYLAAFRMRKERRKNIHLHSLCGVYSWTESKKGFHLMIDSIGNEEGKRRHVPHSFIFHLKSWAFLWSFCVPPQKLLLSIHSYQTNTTWDHTHI